MMMLAQNRITARRGEPDVHKKTTPPKIVSLSVPNKDPVAMTGMTFAGMIKT